MLSEPFKRKARFLATLGESQQASEALEECHAVIQVSGSNRYPILG
jgi:hypothetical protein